MTVPPQDYSGAFDEDLSVKESNNTWLEGGQFVFPEFDLETYYDIARHDENDDHIIRFGCKIPLADIPAKCTVAQDTYRRLQDHHATLDHITGHQTIGSGYGGSTFTPIESLIGHFQVVSITGRTLRLKCGLHWGTGITLVDEFYDPRASLIYSGVNFDTSDPEGHAESFGVGGCIQPGDYVIFVESVLWNASTTDPRSRIECRITKCDFSELPQTGTTNSHEFEIEVDQECDAGALPYSSEHHPYINVLGKRQFREPYVRIGDARPMKYKYRTIEIPIAEVPEGGIIALKDNTDSDCACMFPLRDNISRNFLGTFKLERDLGTGYTDMTASIATTKNGFEHYERFVIAGKHPANTTRLHLKPHGDDDRDLTTDALAFRITFCYESSETDAITGGADRCGEIITDRNKWLDTGTNDWVPTDVDEDGNHVMCRHWKSLTAEQKENFGYRCCQYDCPFFTIHNPRAVDGQYYHQLQNGMGLALYQAGGAGSNGSMAWQYQQIGVPGILYMLSPSEWLHSNTTTAYTNKIEYVDAGRYCFVDPENYYYTTPAYDSDGVTVIGEHHFIAQMNGPFCNGWIANCDWENNRWPAEAEGILARRMPEESIPLSQFSETYDEDHDPTRQRYAERLGRKIASVFENTDAPGGDLQFTATTIPMVWGENSIIRAREYSRYVSGIDMASTAIQGLADDATMQVFHSPKSVYGIENVRAKITLKGR